MLTKAKALYQVKLILDYLPEEEYNLIPQETIDYIEDNFEYDENITINPDIPLENQKIDDKAYEILDKIVKEAEKVKKTTANKEITEYVNEIKKSNKDFNIQIENIKLKDLVDTLKKENAKIPKAKNLLQEYKESLIKKDEEIKKLKANNEQMYNYIQKIPKIIKRIFIKDEVKKLS